MRLIDADALREILKDSKLTENIRSGDDAGYFFQKGWNDAIWFTLMSLEKKPTIEAEPVRHGRWERYCDDKFMGYGADGKIKYRKVYTYECDNCRHGTAVKTNYCPNCGAKMDGGSHE